MNLEMNAHPIEILQGNKCNSINCPFMVNKRKWMEKEKKKINENERINSMDWNIFSSKFMKSIFFVELQLDFNQTLMDLSCPNSFKMENSSFFLYPKSFWYLSVRTVLFVDTFHTAFVQQVIFLEWKFSNGFNGIPGIENYKSSSRNLEL